MGDKLQKLETTVENKLKKIAEMHKKGKFVYFDAAFIQTRKTREMRIGL